VTADIPPASVALSGCGSCTCMGCPYCIHGWFTNEACDCPDQVDGCAYCGCTGCGDCIDSEPGPCGCHVEETP